jgi:hypothetical protein
MAADTPIPHDAVEDLAEVLRPLRNRTWDYWLVLLVITPLVSIIPASWIYTIYTLVSQPLFNFSKWQAVLFMCALAEVSASTSLS